MVNTNIGQVVLPNGFRSVCGNSSQWFDTDRETGYSNFDFVDKHFQSSHTVRRIFSLARKLNFQSFLVETVDSTLSWLVADDVLLHRRNCGFTGSEVYRISFFSSKKNERVNQEDFLGYAVVKKEYFSQHTFLYVYESVLKLYRQEKQNNFLHCKRTYQVAYPFGTFNITGSLYAQQNAKTFVCAHVALRSVLSLLLPEGDISYSEINQLAGIDVSQYPLGENNRGLTPNHIDKVLKFKGIASRKLFYEPQHFPINPITEFSRSLYGYIESGCPSLLAFELTGSPIRHIVPVLGHTFNEDTWVSDARYGYFGGEKFYSSEGWLSTYVIHDDNFGPYLCIPRNYLSVNNFRLLYGLHYNHEALCFDKTESVALERLKSFALANPKKENLSWFNRFVVFAKREQLVLRAIFVSQSQYVKLLQKYGIEDWTIERLKRMLPETFWMVETSCSELFSATRAKFGEVLLTCENVDGNFNGVAKPLAIRLPGVIYFEEEKLPILTQINSYTPLYS
jgi:hypothetical protein